LSDRFFLYDETVNTRTRFVSWASDTNRFDIAILFSDRHFGKFFVMDVQTGRFSIIGPDNLEDEGYIQHAFNLDKEAGEDLRTFLLELY